MNLLKKLRKHFYAGLAYNYFDYSIPTKSEGWLIDKEGITGGIGGRIHGIGISGTYDTRDHSINPEKGWFISGDYYVANKNLGTDFTFNSFKLDARNHIKIADQHVLAVQFYFSYSFGDAPFRIYPKLAMDNLYREFSASRFTDKGAYRIQSEYRATIINPSSRCIPTVGINLFLGAGNVFFHLSALRMNEMKFFGGAGIRLMIDRKNKVAGLTKM